VFGFYIMAIDPFSWPVLVALIFGEDHWLKILSDKSYAL